MILNFEKKKSQSFGAQKTSTVKFPKSFLRFQTKEHVLSVNKSQITGQNAFNGKNFDAKENHELSKNEKTYF